ncbi:hypothetical protein [Aeoliella sp.]|uniref:hypothetical protein n=1 Tax=Aeoliella sp. TaxID=2795800 RepID=UPI003CCC0C25
MSSTKYARSCSLVAAVLAVALAAGCSTRSLAQSPAVGDSESGNADKPSPAVAAKLQTINDAMVLVAVRIDGEVGVVPGVVFHRTGDEALIAAPIDRAIGKAYYEFGTNVNDPQYRVILGKGRQRKAVACRRTSAFDQYRFSVFSAPADQLPPPIPLDVVKQPAPNMRVHVIGYESDKVNRPTAYSGVSEMATLGQVNLDRKGQVDSFDMVCRETPTLSLAVVATTSGEVVGFAPGFRPSNATDGSQYAVKLPSFLTDLLEPTISFLQFGFESGNTKEVVYEFAAVINDPCHRVREPRLSIQWIADARRARARIGLARVEQQPVETLPDARTMELTNQAPSDAFAVQYPAVSRIGEVEVLGARMPAENPGPLGEYAFNSQLSYTDESGAKVHLPPRVLHWSTRFARDGDRLPAIPGVDGKPLDCARPVQLADGTYRITSECTRVSADNSDLKVDVPQPENSREIWGNRVPGAGGRRTVRLDIEPVSQGPRQSIPTMPAVFSPDGAWLYLADAKNTVRKISTTDFREQVYLEFKTPCTSLAYSKAGVVAAVSETIFVLDPETLVVKQTIPTGGVRWVAASPSSDIGFAEGRATWSEDPSQPRTFTQLLMVDYEHGRQIHRIKNGLGCNLRVGRTTFDYGFGPPYLSNDGKQLYLGGQQHEEELHRFRVDGEDLVYEKLFDLETRFIGNGTLVSLKPRSRTCIVGDLQADMQPKFEFMMNSQGPVVVDPQSGVTCLLSRQGSLYAFDSRGEQVGEFVVPRNEVSSLLPHPQGQRFLGWGDKEVFYYDLQIDRLAESGDGHEQDEASAAGTVERIPFTGQLKPFTPGNLLSLFRLSMFEVTSQCEVVQSIDLPKPPGFEHTPNVTDLAVAADGTLYILYAAEQAASGKHMACVAQLGRDRKEWSYWSFPVSHSGFNGNIALRNSGEVAALVTYKVAYLLDPQATAHTPIAIPSGKCMTFGPDGTYYTTGQLDVQRFDAGKLFRYAVRAYDLESLNKTKEVGTSGEPVAMAVDTDGNIYIAQSATVTRIAPDESTTKLDISKDWRRDAILDMALSDSGKLAMGTRSGNLFIVDKDLREESLFTKEGKRLAVGVTWVPDKAE